MSMIKNLKTLIEGGQLMAAGPDASFALGDMPAVPREALAPAPEAAVTEDKDNEAYFISIARGM
jgi:hypothetical protein